MSNVLTTPSRVLTVRYMEPRDLPQVLHIVERTPAPRWARQDILYHFQSSDISSWVAETDRRVTGFAICRVVPRPEPRPAGKMTVPAGSQVVWRADPATQPLRFELLHVAVAPDWQRKGVGRALLQRFDERLRLPDDHIKATVPESNLPVQLFLRAVGYKALRVLRGFYGDEDGYLMERRRG
jgi:[ribosomal protein S18]-alanine N-acetyltransferase